MQEELPFPPKKSGQMAKLTTQESTYNPLPPVSHLPKDAPDILISLIDDVGPGQTDTYGGDIHMPTLSRIAKEAHLGQLLSHYRFMFAYTRPMIYRTKPPPCRERPDCRAGE